MKIFLVILLSAFAFTANSQVTIEFSAPILLEESNMNSYIEPNELVKFRIYCKNSSGQDIVNPTLHAVINDYDVINQSVSSNAGSILNMGDSCWLDVAFETETYFMAGAMEGYVVLKGQNIIDSISEPFSYQVDLFYECDMFQFINWSINITNNYSYLSFNYFNYNSWYINYPAFHIQIDDPYVSVADTGALYYYWANANAPFEFGTAIDWSWNIPANYEVDVNILMTSLGGDYYCVKTVTLLLNQTNDLMYPAKHESLPYPNPCSDNLYFNSADLVGVAYSVNSISGSTVQSGILKDRIDMSEQPAGVYFVRFENGSEIFKVLKK